MKKNGVFDMALEQLDTTAKRIKLNPSIHRVLRHCEKELTVACPVVMNDGRIEVFEGYRVQHSSARGPCKGGIRFHQGVRERWIALSRFLSSGAAKQQSSEAQIKRRISR